MFTPFSQIKIQCQLCRLVDDVIGDLAAVSVASKHARYIP